MNILFLFYAPMVPYIGGIQRVTENLTVEFKKRGHNVYYLNTNNYEPDYDYQFPVPQLCFADNLDENGKVAEYLVILNEYKIETVINQEAREDLLRLLSSTPKTIKTVTCIHLQPFYPQTYYKEIIRNYNRKGIKADLYKILCTLFPLWYYYQTLKLQKSILSKTINSSDKVCLLSAHFIPRIQKFMPEADISKFVAVNNPNTFNSNYSIFNKKKQILWVGRHENTQKNFPIFINFWLKFSVEHPDWEAIVLGEGRDWNYNIQYARNKKAANISFVGNQKDVSHYYKEASFIVVTSFYEGWGMILTEAMNYGCIPCAFDTYESLHDIIESEHEGIIVPPFDVNNLVNKINCIINNPNRLCNMQKSCINKADQFSVDKIVDNWEEMLKTI